MIKFKAEKLQDLNDKIALVYAKYFTDEEVKGLIDLHECCHDQKSLCCETPLGKKFSKLTPSLANESKEIFMSWAMNVGPEFENRINSRFQKEGLQMK